MKKKFGDLPEEGKLLYPLQDTGATAGGHVAGSRTPTGKDDKTRRSAIIQFQVHYQLVFPAAGFQPVRAALYLPNFFHISKLHWNVFAAAAAVTIIYASAPAGALVAALRPITPWLTGQAANAYVQQNYIRQPLNAEAAGDTLYCAVNGACTISGVVIGWESPEQFPVDLPIK